MGKRIALIVAVVAVALALTGNSIGWIQRTELSREEYFASFAQDYREQGKDDDGNTMILVSAPDFSRLQKESARPIAELNVNDLQVLVSGHPAVKKDYTFPVEEVSQESVQEGFFRQLALGYLYQTGETAAISGRWSEKKSEEDAALLASEIAVSTGSSEEPAGDDLKDYLTWYRDGKAENLLLLPENYNYWKVAEALDPENAEAICYQPIYELTEETFAVEDSDYYEILMEELVLMDLDESKTEYASELTFDNLHSFVDAEFEKEVMRKAVVDRLAGSSPGMESLRDDLNNVTILIKNGTESGYEWSESMAVFEVMAESYADFDNLLTTISANSEGVLKEQADTLLDEAKKAMQIRLQTYQSFSNATRSDFDVRWLNAIFFEAARSSEDYANDAQFSRMIDEAEQLFGMVSIRQDMKLNIAAMTVLPQPELTSCMQNTSELIAQAQIDRIIEQAVYALTTRIQKEQSAGTLKEITGKSYIAYSKYLLFGRMHGEYLLHGFVSTDKDVRQWFTENVGTDIVSWYDTKSANLLNMRSDLLKVHESDLESYEGHSYLCVDSGKTWEEAKAFCESMGGHLACINTEGEQKFIESVIKNGDMHQYWLGGYASGEDYVWITGEEFSYTNWDVKEPGGEGLTAGGTYLQILKDADPKITDSKAFGWKLAPVDNIYKVEKPELIKKAEEEAKKAQEAAAAQAAQGQNPENNAAAAPAGADQAAALTPAQQKELETVQKQYKEDLDTVGFYGTDHVGFICEWD
ncbi:MAG: C-type lectin domain-containing protein [Eubacterium sp.]|nr:C-type lectin domain-containing protein [Eubacterium sp.]